MPTCCSRCHPRTAADFEDRLDELEDQIAEAWCEGRLAYLKAEYCRVLKGFHAYQDALLPLAEEITEET